jgi:hypothetical protein
MTGSNDGNAGQRFVLMPRRLANTWSARLPLASIWEDNKSMQWTTKARVQRLCAALPVGREQAYFNLQRLLGNIMGKPTPFSMVQACAELATDFRAYGGRIEGARAMEIGTGRRLDLPILIWLCGAAEVITFDLNRRLRPELVMRAVRMLCADRDRVLGVLSHCANAATIENRFGKLSGVHSFSELIRVTDIRYHAPSDASRTDLSPGSIDLHFSYTVFEHIPLEVIRGILAESTRLLSKGGVAIHHVDVSDHFSHDDATILPINFLRFTQSEWDRIANNQFAYHNRARASEYASVYENAGHAVLSWTTQRHEISLAAIQAGFPLDKKFRGCSTDDLSISVMRITSKPL